jgi:hypothetical protein
MTAAWKSSPNKSLAQDSRLSALNGAISVPREAMVRPTYRHNAMTFISDRFVSLNKIIIGTVIIYSGATTFAHACPTRVELLDAQEAMQAVDAEAQYVTATLTERVIREGH